VTFLIANLKRWFLILALVLASGIDAGWPAVAQPQSSPEYQEYEVKAAFLYNFAKFVEWPAGSFKDAQAPLLIGILGKDPFGEAFDALKDKTIEGRRLLIKRFVKAEDLEKCHILFISAAEKNDVSRVLKITTAWNVLTVGDTKGLAESGVVINFILIKNKIRFEINVDAARRAGLKISSQLLKLAKIHKENS
jgi:hypothetical protein